MWVYFFQLRSWKLKSALCHPAYHPTAMGGFEPEEASDLMDKRLDKERWDGVTRLQVGTAQISWESRKIKRL